jgi:hypothetical protein
MPVDAGSESPAGRLDETETEKLQVKSNSLW